MQKYRSLGLALTFICFFAYAEKAPQEKLPLRKISVCGQNFIAWVAGKEADRTRGLMNFRELKKTEAMLFVFNEEAPRSFWMKNVPYDLDIAYFDSKKQLVSYMTMKGTSPMIREDKIPSYDSIGDAMYAVEVRAGSLKKLPPKCPLVF